MIQFGCKAADQALQPETIAFYLFAYLFTYLFTCVSVKTENCDGSVLPFSVCLITIFALFAGIGEWT